MLKVIIFLLFISPICFIFNSYWMVQNLLFFISFIFVLMNYFTNYWMNISYFLGCDMMSYGLILLSLWICSLMLMASESINKYNNYKNLFLFNVLSLLVLLILTFSSMNLFMFIYLISVVFLVLQDLIF